MRKQKKMEDFVAICSSPMGLVFWYEYACEHIQVILQWIFTGVQRASGHEAFIE